MDESHASLGKRILQCSSFPMLSPRRPGSQRCGLAVEARGAPVGSGGRRQGEASQEGLGVLPLDTALRRRGTDDSGLQAGACWSSAPGYSLSVIARRAPPPPPGTRKRAPDGLCYVSGVLRPLLVPLGLVTGRVPSWLSTWGSLSGVGVKFT